ncbi:MAG: hypothetical protein WBL45_04455, partial [Solirubrobacterales bacterium]
MRSLNLRLGLLCLSLALVLVAIPGLSLGASPKTGADGASERSAPTASSSAKRAKKRCKKAHPQAKAAKRRACKKRKPH